MQLVKTAISAGMLLAMPLLAEAASKTVSASDHWQVNGVTKLDSLIIEKGSSVTAPKGYDLTLTVNGTSVPLKPGNYSGNITLTPTRSYLVKYRFYEPYHYRAGLVVHNDQVIQDQSVFAALGDPDVSDVSASNLSIRSQEENFNGVIVSGDSTYTLNNVDIDFTGNGGNDFAGWGAGIMSTDTATVIVNNASIKTLGAVRTALFIGGKSTMIINDADIEVQNGKLPADYTFSIAPGEMLEVPYGLGLSGNVRATNLIDEATVYYNDCHIKANGWGALSSDGDGPSRMFVNRCIIDVTDSGYGAYANGDSHDYISHTVINVPDVGVIVGGPGWVTLTDESVINSEKLGVMMHQGAGGSVLRVEKGSQINSKNSAVQIKGRGGDVIVDNAILNPLNGVLVQAMENDDPIMKDMAKNGPPPPPPGSEAMPPPDMPGASAMNFSPDVNVTFRNTKLTGDVLHAMSELGNMNVYLQSATLEGAISTSVTFPTSGQEPTKETYRSVGEVSNRLQKTTNKHKLKVFVDQDTTWHVSKTSYIDAITIAEGATIEVSTGELLFKVNGKPLALTPGSYTGDIEIGPK